MIDEARWEEIERAFTFRHSLLGGVRPVRVLIRRGTGSKAGAIAPRVTDGRLHFENTLLSRIETSPEVEEIDEATFLRLAAAQRGGAA